MRTFRKDPNCTNKTCGHLESALDQLQVTLNEDELTFESVKSAIKAKDWEMVTAEIAWVPQTEVTPDAAHVPKVEALLNALEDHDDVQAVHTNYSPPA